MAFTITLATAQALMELDQHGDCISLDARIRAVEAIRLPLTELLSPDQLELFGGL